MIQPEQQQQQPRQGRVPTRGGGRHAEMLETIVAGLNGPPFQQGLTAMRLDAMSPQLLLQVHYKNKERNFF